jgi:hypothetical protein
VWWYCDQLCFTNKRCGALRITISSNAYVNSPYEFGSAQLSVTNASQTQNIPTGVSTTNGFNIGPTINNEQTATADTVVITTNFTPQPTLIAYQIRL